MKRTDLKRTDKSRHRTLKQEENITVKEDTVTIKKNERIIFQILDFTQYNALMKLRFIVSLIFSLCTISMILIFIGAWIITAALLLIGYILLFILMIKLFLTKRL